MANDSLLWPLLAPRKHEIGTSHAFVEGKDDEVFWRTYVLGAAQNVTHVYSDVESGRTGLDASVSRKL